MTSTLTNLEILKLVIKNKDSDYSLSVSHDNLDPDSFYVFSGQDELDEILSEIDKQEQNQISHNTSN